MWQQGVATQWMWLIRSLQKQLKKYQLANYHGVWWLN